MEDCLFCKIIAGQIPSTAVYEDDLVYAFKDINPAAPVHVLLVPKKHIRDLTSLSQSDQGLIGQIHLVAAKIADELGIAAEGFRLVNNCKERGGQTVFHLHFHLLGGRDFHWPPG